MTNTDTAYEIQRLLQLKLEVPRLPSNVLTRSRLIDALGALDACRLILLTAPAGFGKTTLLTQWRDHVREAGHLVGWLTLDEGDGDVRRFLIGVIRALEVAGVLFADLGAQAGRGLSEVTIEKVIELIHARSGEASHPITLILDDYHRASSPQLDSFLERWIPRLPASLRLLMSTRRRPDIALNRLLVTGDAVEITSDMLRFTQTESRQVLDVGQSMADRDTLAERIEGWPVALQLARLISLRGQAGGLPPHGDPLALSRLTARGGHLWDFLSDQVLRGLDEEAVDFLLETSILERFSAQITDAVRARDDSWRIMEQLEALQSLITPLDAGATWYRYHHLFAEYLQAQLSQRRPAQVPQLHLRASHAFEDAGLLTEAVRHASLAGDFERCAELVEQAGGWRLVLFGGMGHLEQLLDYIPQAERLSHPRLLIAEAYVRLKMGDLREARALFDLVGSEVREPPEDWSALDDYQRDILNIGILIRIYEDNSVDGALVDLFETIQAHLPNADGLTRGVLACAAAVGNLCLGRLSKAEDAARDAMGGMRDASSVVGLNYCFLHSGLSRAYRGDLDSAIAYLQHAKAMAVENFGADSGLKALTEVLLFAVQFWRDGPDGSASDELDAAFRHVWDYDGWFEIYAAALDTRFRQAWLAHDTTAMDAVIADGEGLIRSRGLNRLCDIVDAQRLLLASAAAHDEGASAPLVQKLSGRFPLEAWKQDAALWRPYQDAAWALGMVLSRSSPKQARARVEDALDCARAVKARFHEVRALLLLARIDAALDDHYRAMVHLREAVTIAAPQDIALPFLEQRALLPLVRQLKRDLWDAGSDPLEASFLAGISERIAQSEPASDSPMDKLSTREQEVVAELSRGLTNKEIARALDMTEHTVKFHLKNIFAKLGVDRRAHALSVLRDVKPFERG